MLRLLKSRYHRPQCIRNIHSSRRHLHGRRRKLYRGLHASRKWNHHCCRKRRWATSHPFYGTSVDGSSFRTDPQVLERASFQRVVGGVPDTAILHHSSRLSRYDVTSSLIRYRTHSTDAHGHILDWGARAQLPLESCASADGTR